MYLYHASILFSEVPLTSFNVPRTYSIVFSQVVVHNACITFFIAPLLCLYSILLPYLYRYVLIPSDIIRYLPYLYHTIPYLYRTISYLKRIYRTWTIPLPYLFHTFIHIYPTSILYLYHISTVPH